MTCSAIGCIFSVYENGLCLTHSRRENVARDVERVRDALPGKFTIKVRGVDVSCDSIESLEMLLQRFGERDRTLAPFPKQEDSQARPLKLISQPPVAATSSTLLRPTSLKAVVTAPVRWLWNHRIPAGMLTVLYAAPGVGKGTLAATLAAVTTTGGELPEDEGQREPGSVLFVVTEDHPNLTLRPRLDAAGADADRVEVFGPELRLKLPKHAADIEAAVRASGAKLVVVDPLRGITNGDSKSKVRESLVALEEMASRTGATVLVIHHTNRAGNLHGSQDILGIPRSVLRIDVDDVTGIRRVRQEKKNLAPDVGPVAFRIVDRDGVGVVEWLSAEEADPPAVLAPVEEADDRLVAADRVLADLGISVVRPTVASDGVLDGDARALSLEEVAAYLGIRATVLRYRIRQMSVPALTAAALMVDGQHYWTRSAVDTLIERRLMVVAVGGDETRVLNEGASDGGDDRRGSGIPEPVADQDAAVGHLRREDGVAQMPTRTETEENPFVFIAELASLTGRTIAGMASYVNTPNGARLREMRVKVKRQGVKGTFAWLKGSDLDVEIAKAQKSKSRTPQENDDDEREDADELDEGDLDVQPPAIDGERVLRSSSAHRLTEEQRATLRRCPCCNRVVSGAATRCPECLFCKEVASGKFDSTGMCPKIRAKTLRPITPAQVEQEMHERAQKKPADYDPLTPSIVKISRPKYEPF